MLLYLLTFSLLSQSYLSAVIDRIYHFAETFGMTSEIAIGLSFFYATQCCGPTLFSTALKRIMSKDSVIRRCFNRNNHYTIYNALVEECCIIVPDKKHDLMSVGMDAIP